MQSFYNKKRRNGKGGYAQAKLFRARVGVNLLVQVDGRKPILSSP
jgi:hypothetical protein